MKKFNTILWDKRTLLLIILIELFIIVGVLFTDTGIDAKPYEDQIKTLQTQIELLDDTNLQLQVSIDNMYEQAEGYELTIKELTKDLAKVKSNTNEKINSVNGYNVDELQKFFTDRYDTLPNN